jgi:beta-mannosidase
MKRIDLSGIWSLRLLSGGQGERIPRALSEGEAIPMRIPGDTVSALLLAGRVADPSYRLNELDLQWVGGCDWLLSREVQLEGEWLSGRHAFLSIRSLDTCAEVRVNGRPVGSSRNMFCPFGADLEGCLRPGGNLVEVLLRSPERSAAEVAAALPYPVPHTVSPVQSMHRNLIRKVQCHSGWDWGPCLMVSGIYGEASLGLHGQARVEQVHTRQQRQGSSWELEVTVELFAWEGGRLPVEITLGPERFEEGVEIGPGPNVLRRTLRLRDAELWWPAGHGAQPLYELGVAVGEERVGKRIGFRSLEVLLEDDEQGRGLSFAVNGRRVFCKGANWLPLDALPARHSEPRYRRLLTDAVAANMNMLRVWGGGQYEADGFYNICDEKGILVWQDFMFSCATYPAIPPFLAEVEREARHQVKRLKDHPCVALWCGNNENLGALGWFPETRANRDRYLVDYDRLNEGVLGRVVHELDPDRTWWPSSPCAGEGDYSDNWHDDRKGDMHYWSVWHEGKSFEAYYAVTPRFASEFGFQSFPSLQTVGLFAPEQEWNPTSPAMEHHQRHPRGNAIIVETMTRYFRVPDGFESFVYLSQVQQALAMKMAVEYWRSRRPVCMGTLYWQLNDVWPVVSWSSIEHSGRWKLLHYAARHFYAPLHVAAFCTDGRTVEVVGLNDDERPRRGTLCLRFFDFAGQVRHQVKEEVELPAEAATPLASIALGQLPASAEELFLALRFESGELLVENELFLCPPKRCSLQDPGLRWSLTGEENEPCVELTAERPAFYVSLDSGDLRGTFSDNLFTLLPGDTRRIGFAEEEGGESDTGGGGPPAAAGGAGGRRGGGTPVTRPAKTGSLAEQLRVLHLRASYR